MEIFRLFGSIFVDSRDANDNINDVGENAERTGRTLGDMIGTAAKWGAGLALAVGGAAIALGVKGVGAAEEFKRAMNGLQTETGATQKEMAEFEQTAKNIYNNNFGENFEEIAQTMGLVKQTTGATGAELEKLATNALLLRDAFDLDVNESVRSADKLMRQFGISGDEAMALIAEGTQKGLNFADDLLPTLDEYSVYFDKAGFSAQEMFGLFENAKKAGIFNLDYAADAMKEFGIIMATGGEDTNETLKQLGLNGAELTKQFGKGGDSAKAAFQTISAALASVKDPQEQYNLGVDLFGTKFEDVGAKGILALSAVNDGIKGTQDTLQSINNVKYDTFGETLEGIKRNLETAILIPIGEKILPKLKEFADWIKKHMPEIKATIAVALDKAFEAFDAFGDAISFVIDNLDTLLPILAGVTAAITAQLIINVVTAAYKAWRTATAAQTTAQWLLNAAMNANPLGLVAIAIGVVVAAAILLYKHWDLVKEKTVEVWGVIKRTFTTVMDWVKENWQGLLLLILNPFAGAVKLLYDNNEAFREWIDKLYHIIVDPIKKLPDEAVELGKNIIEGLINGFLSLKGKIDEKVSEVVNKIPLAVRKLLGIASPSKVMHGYGVNITEGLANGIGAGTPDVVKKAQEMAEKLKAKTVDGLTKLGDAVMIALRKMYSEQQKADEAALDKRLNSARTYTQNLIKTFKAARDARFEDIKNIEDPEVKKRRDEIKAIEKQTEDEERYLNNLAYQKSLLAKQEGINAEEDAAKRVELQEEMNSMIADHDRELLLESRRIKQEELEAQIEAIETGAEEARKAAENKYENDVEYANNTLTAKEQSLGDERKAVAKHYEELSKDEAVAAEARRLAMATSNTEMIALLTTFNPDWQNAGQSWADSLLEGINSKKESIKTAVADIMSLVQKANTAAAALLPAATQQGPLGMDINSFIKTVVPGYAGGTDNHPGGLAVVGEEGPELLNLPRGSRVTPNNELIGSTNVYNNYTFAPGAVVIPAKDLNEIKTIQDFFQRITQVARTT